MILSVCLLTPLVAAAIILLVPARHTLVIRLCALAGAAVPFCLACMLFMDHGRADLGDSAARYFTARTSEVLEEVSSNPNDAHRVILHSTLLNHPSIDDPIFAELERAVTPSSRTHKDLYFESLEYALASRSALAEGIRSTEYRPWIPALNVHWFLGVDGLSLPLVWLVCLLALACVLYSREMSERVKSFHVLLLLTLAGLIGALVSLDLFLLVCSWQLVLLPLFLLVGGWGGEGKGSAALELFLHGQAACMVFFFVLLAYHFTPSDIQSTNLLALAALAQDGSTFSLDFQTFALLCLLAVVAVFLPIFPLHGWMLRAHHEAPPAASALLVTCTMVMGGYALARIGLGLCPDAFASDWLPLALGSLGLVNLVHGTLAARAQERLGPALVYLLMAQSGIVLVAYGALTQSSLAGAVLHMVVQGALFAFLFLATGALADRGGTLDRAGLADVGARAPRLAWLTVVALLGVAGAPGLGAFISDLTILVGAWGSEEVALARGQSAFLPHWIVVLLLLAIPLVAAAILPWALSLLVRVRSGGEEEVSLPVSDATLREQAALLPLLAAAIVLGILPQLGFDVIYPAARTMASLVDR